MPKKVIDRADMFGSDDDEMEGTEMVPSSRPYMPMDEADAVRNNQFPTTRHVSPKVLLEQEKARREELETELAQARAAGQALASDGTIVVQGFQLTPTGLMAPQTVSPDAWVDVGRLLAKLEGSLQWLVGDWLVYGEAIQWGDIPALAQELGFAVQTLYDYASVSRKVQFSIRIENLSFAHHRLVMSMTPDYQSYALQFAAHQKYSVAAMRKWIKLGMPEEGLLDEQEQPALLAAAPVVKDREWDNLRSDVERISHNPSLIQSMSADERKAIAQRLEKLLKLLKAANNA
jgi:hypothetical protein